MERSSVLRPDRFYLRKERCDVLVLGWGAPGAHLLQGLRPLLVGETLLTDEVFRPTRPICAADSQSQYSERVFHYICFGRSSLDQEAATHDLARAEDGT